MFVHRAASHISSLIQYSFEHVIFILLTLGCINSLLNIIIYIKTLYFFETCFLFKAIIPIRTIQKLSSNITSSSAISNRAQIASSVVHLRPQTLSLISSARKNSQSWKIAEQSTISLHLERHVHNSGTLYPENLPGPVCIHFTQTTARCVHTSENRELDADGIQISLDALHCLYARREGERESKTIS